MIDDILGFSIYFGIALALAVVATLGLGLTLHAGTRVSKEPLPLLFFGIVVAIMAPPIATGRFITAGMGVSEASFEDIGASFWINRLVTLGILLLCTERFVRFVVRREWTNTHSWGLFWAFMAFALTNQILNGIFGSHPSFEHKVLYAFPFYFSVFLVAQSQPERCFLFVRSTLLFFFFCSALALALMPPLVLDKAYADGLIVPIRYYGLATHANTLGPLAVAFMICLWRFPFDSRWINLFSWLLALTSLILSQSKTTICAAIVIGFFLVSYRYYGRVMQSLSKGRNGIFIGGMACVCFFLSVVILSAWLGADVVERWVNQIDHALGGRLGSLTGRTKIWAIAWEEFLASPWFGYGPSIWGDFYRFIIGIRTAYSAHNQLLQSLSSAGLMGLTGLILYASVLFIYALRAAPLSGGISVALVSLMLLRSFLEAPFTSSNAITSDFFVHLLALVACTGFLSPKPNKLAADAYEAEIEEKIRGRYPGWGIIQRRGHEN